MSQLTNAGSIGSGPTINLHDLGIASFSGDAVFHFPSPTVLSGEEVYDSIMGEIEPELLSKNIILLEEKYKEETPDQKKARGERYGKAFAEYEKHYQKYLADSSSTLQRFKGQALKSVEDADRKQDAMGVQSLEAQMSSM